MAFANVTGRTLPFPQMKVYAPLCFHRIGTCREDMVDPLSPEDRSRRMSRVKPRGNRSTEGKVAAALFASGIEGWVAHPKGIAGRPDFYFPDQRLMLFVDGCFWHACPVCQRNWPTNRAEFWREKIEGNRRRDNRKRRQLRAHGYHVMRVWEHDLKRDTWLKRLQSMLSTLGTTDQL